LNKVFQFGIDCLILHTEEFGTGTKSYSLGINIRSGRLAAAAALLQPPPLLPRTAAAATKTLVTAAIAGAKKTTIN
jgi:hypothetical protein